MRQGFFKGQVRRAGGGLGPGLVFLKRPVRWGLALGKSPWFYVGVRETQAAMR